MSCLDKLSKNDKKQIVELYQAGVSCKELGEDVGYSTRMIQRYLKSEGVIRTRRESYIIAIREGRMTYDHLRKKVKTGDFRKTVNPAQRFRIFSRDNFRCVICGISAKEGARLQVDHKKELCYGGKHTEENMQTLCIECNTGKYQVLPVNKGKHKGKEL